MQESDQQHWDKIYLEKQSTEMSWTQNEPTLSLYFIHRFQINKDASIIDIGGGDSKLVDYLLAEGFTNLTVLDISSAAIHKAQQRLGSDAQKVKWIVSDILNFKPNEKYEVWHDRAAFHFQTDIQKIQKYLHIVKNAVERMVIIGTFSLEGPSKCSGLAVQQYNEKTMKEIFEDDQFENLECKREDHISPMGVLQNFVFCSFIKK